MTRIDVEGLAKLARLAVPSEELARLEKEIPEILGFVETIQAVGAEAPHEIPAHRNVLREDENPHESGVHTRTLIDAAPAQKGDAVVVKQVISK